ncbi:MAG: hypothetical protein WCI73_16265 [Phycisphaerae bacterium]
MDYKLGQLVSHSKFGIGKIIKIDGNRLEIVFKTQGSKPITIATDHFRPEVLANQSDPVLDRLDVSKPYNHKVRTTKPRKTKLSLTHEQAINKFVNIFHLGFSDPKYFGTPKTGERCHKLQAHELWVKTLDQKAFAQLLADKEYEEIVGRALKVGGKTDLLFKQEKMALHDAVQEPEAAEKFARGLFDLIYGTDGFEGRFNRFTEVLDALPQGQTGVANWPTQTIFPFLALPKEHLFLKPAATQHAAEGRNFSLNYQSRPNWQTYSCLLRFGELLMQDLAHLKPQDMIDIQSFIWVVETYKNP